LQLTYLLLRPSGKFELLCPLCLGWGEDFPIAYTPYIDSTGTVHVYANSKQYASSSADKKVSLFSVDRINYLLFLAKWCGVHTKAATLCLELFVTAVRHQRRTTRIQASLYLHVAQKKAALTIPFGFTNRNSTA
jgi:hypothetical protein